MKIGSNNSLTYLKPPRTWWLKIFYFLRKKQDIDYEDQYVLYGIRVFDFRLYVDKHGRIVTRNNCDFSLYEALNFLNKKGDAMVSISLDMSEVDYLANPNTTRIISSFIEKCRIIKTIYKNIKFYGGYRKFDKKVLYNFNNKVDNVIVIEDISKKYKFISIFCPFLLYNLNKKYIEQYKDSNKVIMLNYIDKK